MSKLRNWKLRDYIPISFLCPGSLSLFLSLFFVARGIQQDNLVPGARRVACCPFIHTVKLLWGMAHVRR